MPAFLFIVSYLYKYCYFCGVRRSFKITGVLLIGFIYCLAVGVVMPVKLAEKGSTEKSAFITTASANLFNYLNEKESRVNSQVQFQVKNFNKPYELTNPFSRTLLQRFKTAVRQSLTFNVHLLIQKKKSTLIYPFNYFW